MIIKTVAKAVVDLLQEAFVLCARALHVIDFPVPLNSGMRKTSSKSIRHYYISGTCTYLPIAVTALQRKVRLDQNIRVLDFGCGVGRQLLHFTRFYPAPCYHACDVDGSAIDFITKNYPRVMAYTSPFQPQLKYADGYFDMVYSVSIFSHLCLEDHKPWLLELGRITKPGGFCFLTTEGFTALKYLAASFSSDATVLREKLACAGALYKEYNFLEQSRKAGGFLNRYNLCVGVEGSYGNTVLSPAYIIKEWDNACFEVVDVIEGIVDHRQDLVVLRRK